MSSPSFVHPVTYEPLSRKDHGYETQSGEIFLDKNTIPCFISSALEEHMNEERTGFINTLKVLLRKSPTLYRFLIFLISPVCFTGISAKKFLKQYNAESCILNIGSGIHRYRKDQTNIDIFPDAEVDVIADATALPIASNSVDAVVCEYLLEHVPNPQAVIDEILRVLKKGGKAYIATPFVYPFHACPNDFHRWTIEGLRYALRKGDIKAIGTRVGPTSALTAHLVTWVAIVVSFGSQTIYSIASTLLLVVFFPLKFLDVLFGRFPTSIHGAACFYVIVEKK